MTDRAAATAEAILAAARTAFGESGYDRATIRGIAAAAGVDPALVHHYFGTKADLYARAIALPVSPSEVIATVFTGDRSGLGERLTRFFFGVWERPEGREPFLAMLRGAFGGNERGTAGFRQFVVHGMLAPVAAEVGGDDAPIRVELALAHLVGIAVLRYVVAVEPVATLPVDELVRRLAPHIQRHLAG